ncbi:MAG: hypothetical protein ACK4SY_01910, partial [Pyrobaculum sp.]
SLLALFLFGLIFGSAYLLLKAVGNMGFVYNGTHLSMWTGLHVVENYDVSNCEKNWFKWEGKTAFRVGIGMPGLASGWLRVSDVGEGIGVVIGRSEWGLFIRCKEVSFIISAPGLRP